MIKMKKMKMNGYESIRFARPYVQATDRTGLLGIPIVN